jgi:hypothetical protein
VKRFRRAIGALAIACAALFPFTPEPASAHIQSYGTGLTFFGPGTSCFADIEEQFTGVESKAFTTSFDCYGTYTRIYTYSSGICGEGSGNPVSSYVVCMYHQYVSWHTACFGLFSCSSYQPVLEI